MNIHDMAVTARRLALGSAILLIGGLTPSPPALARTQQVPVAVRDDPLTLFAAMTPVLKHDRCVNCHGATDPYRGFYHPGAVPYSSICVNCHTATPLWKLAPSSLAFHGKSTRQLCDHFAALDPLGSPFLDQHLQTDDLINQGFIGRRGGAVPAQYTERPPMTKAEFMRAFRTWVQVGGAACSGWEGTITEDQYIGGNVVTLNALGGEVSHFQQGNRKLTITIKDGEATVSSSVSGFDNNRHTVTSGGCEVTIHSQRVYHIVAQEPSPNAPPLPPSPPPPPGQTPLAPPIVRPGSVRIGLDQRGNYRILVTPPGETIMTTEYGQATNTCGAPNPNSQDTNYITWDPFVVEIVGTLPNAANRRRLQGQSEVDMTTDDAGRTMGIEVYGSASEVDGRPIPFKVKRTWDLRRLP